MSVCKSREGRMQQESNVHGSLCPSPALHSRQLGFTFIQTPQLSCSEIRPDISQNKLYGNAFQACKTWQERWLLTAQESQPALKVIICLGFATQNYWQRNQGSRVGNYFKICVLVQRPKNMFSRIKLFWVPPKHYLLIPCHQHRDFWLQRSPQSILSGVHSRICPGESSHRCPPCTIHSPAHRSSPCQKDSAECSRKQCQAGVSTQTWASDSSQGSMTHQSQNSLSLSCLSLQTEHGHCLPGESCLTSLDSLELREIDLPSVTQTMKSTHHGLVRGHLKSS